MALIGVLVKSFKAVINIISYCFIFNFINFSGDKKDGL